jgi:hypothetical protein
MFIAAALVGGTTPAAGCASRGHVATDAPLGRVIIYRNGVAYFERRASVEDEMTLEVPRERVDDFLKSLTVVDATTGKSLPISYPTTRTTSGSTIAMRIPLPHGRRDVRIAYVTESPAWKPSYRIVLDDGGAARLQAWAIVDNVSGEAWKRVVVGVGTTSALSFRYDLHSVRMVERETIDGGTKLAHAPPEGGSPYAVDGTTVRVLAELDARAFTATVEATPTSMRDSAGISLAGSTGAESKYTVEGANAHGRVVSMEEFRNIPVGSSQRDFVHATAAGPTSRGARRSTSAATPTKPSAPREKMGLATLAAELKNNGTRIRVEGYAQRGDGDKASAALRRANTVRESMVERGIAADRIEVVGHETLAPTPDRLVRVVAIDDGPRPARARSEHDDGKPSGSALFLADGPMTIEAGHSAMVTLFDESTTAERVYLYDPVSPRGSKRFAFDAVRIRNPTTDTLDTGPMTVYASSRFLGEGLTEPIPPGASAIVPFGLDHSIVVEGHEDTREEIESLRKIERGIATTETQRIRRTSFEITNRAPIEARVFVRHHVPTGWTLVDPPKGLERLRGDTLIPVSIPANGRARLELEAVMPITTTVDIRSADGSQALEVFSRKGVTDPELARALEAVVTAQRELRDVEDQLASRAEHMAGLRARVEELTEQLVALRKVGRAQGLSNDLARRARRLGATLDDVAGEITTLETQRLQRSIELGNLVAELTLDPAR